MGKAAAVRAHTASARDPRPPLFDLKRPGKDPLLRPYPAKAGVVTCNPYTKREERPIDNQYHKHTHTKQSIKRSNNDAGVRWGGEKQRITRVMRPIEPSFRSISDKESRNDARGG